MPGGLVHATDRALCRIGRVRRLSSSFVIAVVVGSGGCGDATPVDSGVDRYTQGGVSMEPTVDAGQVINVRPVGGEYTPGRGDIVLFHPSGGQWGDRTVPFLKRVVAIGGETIACCDSDGNVTIDGTPLDEPYVANDSPLDEPPSPDHPGPESPSLPDWQISGQKTSGTGGPGLPRTLS